MLYFEKSARNKGFSFIVGVDEAGRGPLAGPVVAAAVKLKKTKFNNYIDDSKKLSPLERERAFIEIFQKAEVGIGIMNETVIDAVNILNATKLAMEKAVANLFYLSRKKINKNKIIVLLDGRLSLNLPFKIKNIIRGDSKSLSIASASIVAKVTRDRIMFIYDKIYPKYYFGDHKGYGTKVHFKAIKKYGSCSIHRMSFSPLKQF
ncbi:MAG: ribonuclease HII [Candidatus Omnitrophica bacterium]|nr:ribonuclease HII [Candidatus Omnitrophota bacterium]